MANWYVKRGNQTAGPLTQERLKELAVQGKVQELDLVRKGEDGPFVTAGKIPGLIPAADSEAWDEFEVDTQAQSKAPASKKSNTTLIVILAVFVGGLFLVVPILLALLLPAVQQAREAARRSTSKNHMKQIGLALHNYHDVFTRFPPGGIETTDGKPYHSWQTQILPFMEWAPLYNDIDFDKPWNDASNQIIFQQEIPQYLNPTIEEKFSPDGYGLSHYVGNKLVLKKNTGIQLREITDGTSNTIIAVETGENFKPWGDPTYLAEPADIMGPGKKTSYRGGNHILLGDGSVRFVSEHIDPSVLKALSTPNGGEIVGEL